MAIKPVLIGVGALLWGSLAQAAEPPPSPWSLFVPQEQAQFLARNDRERRGRQWEQLTPEERENIRQRQQQYEALPPGEKRKIHEARERYQQLSPQERRELREEWRRHKTQESQEEPRDRRGRSRGRD